MSLTIPSFGFMLIQFPKCKRLVLIICHVVFATKLYPIVRKLFSAINAIFISISNAMISQLLNINNRKKNQMMFHGFVNHVSKICFLLAH